MHIRWSISLIIQNIVLFNNTVVVTKNAMQSIFYTNAVVDESWHSRN